MIEGAAIDVAFCRTCSRTLSLESFHRRAEKDNGRCSNCIECCRKQREEIPAETRKAYRDKRRSAGLQRFATWKYLLKKSYGLSVEQYHAMERNQFGLCKICKQPETGKHGRLHVDHNHATGEVRGLLCGKCNVMIGYAREDADILKSAISYLARGA